MQCVIPAQAGIHVFRALKWTSACAGVTVIGDIIAFEILCAFDEKRDGPEQTVRNCIISPTELIPP